MLFDSICFFYIIVIMYYESVNWCVYLEVIVFGIILTKKFIKFSPFFELLLFVWEGQIIQNSHMLIRRSVNLWCHSRVLCEDLSVEWFPWVSVNWCVYLEVIVFGINLTKRLKKISRWIELLFCVGRSNDTKLSFVS